MKRVSWFIGVCMCLLLSSAAWGNSENSKPGGLFIEVDGPLLTVKAKDVPHREILRGIAERLNFELVIYGSLEERYSLELEHRPWENALKKALFPASWTFIYEIRRWQATAHQSLRSIAAVGSGYGWSAYTFSATIRGARARSVRTGAEEASCLADRPLKRQR